ncbi:MAG TPA: Fe-S cluster assembly protein SufD [Alphaproteobacteria bacterium]|jgi:Fe-S cluster assembly protein SufD|nr:Fe-S cluster assembly protein SufD [Alphaproteobacteria bacterium]
MSTVTEVSPGWLTALREAGKAGFTGLPTQRQEAWKYTGLNKLKALTFEPTRDGAQVPAALADIGAIAAAHRLVFVNGRYAADRSSIGKLPDGVVLGCLADILNTQPALLETRLGKAMDTAHKPMAALNTAWIADGLVLIVPRGVAVAGNIEVVFAATGEAPVAHPRLMVALGDMAEATLIERHLGGAGGGFANQVAEIALGNGAQFRHYVLHVEPSASMAVETVLATIGRDAAYKAFALNAGGGLVRREVEVQLAQPGGFAQVDGAYLVDGDRHTDTTVLIDHQADHCASRQTQKGVIDNDGRAVYQGKILVRPNAQKTDGYQLSQTLLLSPQAEIDVKPELEIHADDVKCSHGATVGRLDADALFFLRARGIPEAEARALLIQGFIGGALDEIDRDDVREAFGLAAANWLAGRSAPKGDVS